jgi:hypothetical protein
MTSAARPAGFVAGVNYFVDPAYGSRFAGMNSWQSVNVTGLTDGEFVADIIGVPGFNWINLSNNLLPHRSALYVVNIPEPSTLALLGFARHRKQKAA